MPRQLLEGSAHLGAFAVNAMRSALMLCVAVLACTICCRSQGGDHPWEITPTALYPLEGTPGERIARAFQGQYQYIEQPTVVVSGATVLPNPEHRLNQGSLTFEFKQLFLTPADFASVLKTYYAAEQSAHKNQKIDLGKLCGRGSIVRCVATGGGWWNRAFYGLTLTVTLAERQRVIEKGMFVPESFSNHYDVAGEVKFDPTSVFLTASDWKAALGALGAIGKDRLTYPNADSQLKNTYEGCLDVQTDQDARAPVQASPDAPNPGLLAEELHKKVRKCIRTFGGTKRGGLAVLALAIPTFQYKRVTQFDFLKYSGVLITNPATQKLESGLNTVSFTWDLRRTIGTVSSRVDAVELMPKTEHKSATGDKLCVVAVAGVRSFISVPTDASASGCQKAAESLGGASEYQLACATRDAVTIGKSASTTETAPAPGQNSCGWK